MSATSELTKKNLEQFEGNTKLPTPSQEPLLKFNLEDKSRLSTAQGTADSTGGASEVRLSQSPFESDFFNSKLLGFDLGSVDDSAFTPASIINPFNSNIDFEKLRADKQSAFTKIGAMGVQFIGKTAIGIVGNIVGGFYGLGAAAINADSDLLFDNSVYRTLDEANESIEAKNSIFVNSKDHLGFNWRTAKNLKDAFEFITQAATSELIMQSVGNLAGGAGIASFTGRAGRYINRINKLVRIIDGAKDTAQLERIALQLGTTVEKLASARRNIDAFKATTKLARTMMTTTGYEASLEARGAADEFESNMLSKLEKYLSNSNMSDEDKEAYRAEFMKRLEQDKSIVGLGTFLGNTALLSISNIVQFPGIFGSKYINARNINRLERAALGEVQRKATNKYIAGLANAGRILKSPVMEFFEETGQGVISNTAQNYYETILAEDTNVHTLNPLAMNFAKSLAAGIKETYTTREGIEEGIIGAIVGGIGLPGFRKAGNKAKFQWQGGVVGSYRDIQTKKKYTEDVINSINSAKLSEGMAYQKDNAIRASIDKSKEDFAVIMENPMEYESTQTNKVFRYANERLKRGLGQQIQEDIAELTDMANNNIEKYRQTFGKDETFTREDAIKEVTAFSEKIDIYQDAYNKVNRGFRFADYSIDSTAHNKLSEVLTHSLAMSKIWGDQLNATKQRLYDINNKDFTAEEIDAWAETSLKVAIAGLKIEEFIEERQAAKDAKNKDLIAIKNSRFAPALEKSLETLKEEIAELEAQDPATVNQPKLDGLRNVVKVREQAEFQFNKSKQGRALKAKEKEILKEVNEKLKKSVSNASKELGKKIPKDLTMKELEDYLNQKAKIVENINKEENTSFELDRQEFDDDGMNLIDKINELNDRFKTASEIAASLYKFKNEPFKAYNKILNGELYANLNNVSNKTSELLFLTITNEGESDKAKLLVLELEADLELLKAKLEDYKSVLNKELKELLEETIHRAEVILENYNKVVEKKQELVEQQEEAIKRVKTEEEILEELNNELDGLPKADKEDDTRPKSTDSPAVLADKKNNRLVITDTNKKGGPRMGNADYNLKEAIEEGRIKDKAASTLELDDTKLDPNSNPYLMNALKERGVSVDSYMKGWNKIRKNPKLLLKENEKLDEDIINFITFAPIIQKIYNKVATREGKHYTFEITKEDREKGVVFEQFLFNPDDTRNISQTEKDNDEVYKKEMEQIIKDRDRILEEQKALGSERQFTTSEIRLVYNNKAEAAYYKYKASFNNSYTLLNMRKALLDNFFNNKINELKLKVHEVNQGDFQHFRDRFNNPKPVEERNVSELGFNENTVTINELMYGDQQGRYRLMSGEKVEDISGHPLQHATGRGSNGKIYMLYTNKAGRAVPIQMNTSTISKEDFKLIYRVFTDYLLTQDKDNFVVKGTGLKFIDNKNYSMTNFLKLFLVDKNTKTDSPIFLNNTFALINQSKRTSENELMLQIFRGDITSEETSFKFPKFDGSNKAEIMNALKANKKAMFDSMVGLRRPINRSLLIQEKKVKVEGFKEKQTQYSLDKEVLKYLFDNNIINHTFDVENNFDKIYQRDANKHRSITLSRADIDDTEAAKYVPEAVGFGKAMKALRRSLGVRKKDDVWEVNETDVIINFLNSLNWSIRRQNEIAVKQGKKFNLKDAVKLAVDNYVDRQVAKIMEVARRFEGQWNEDADHANNTKFDKENDKILDELLKYFYSMRKSLGESKSFLKQISSNRKALLSSQAIIESLKKPKAGASVRLNKLDPKNDKRSTTSGIKSPEQLDSIMLFLKTLHDIAKTGKKGSNYVHITYTKDYPQLKGNNAQNVNWSDDNLRSGKLENVHMNTRLKSIEIVEQPEMKQRSDGTWFMSKGLVYGNFGAVRGVDDKGRPILGNDRLVLISADGSMPSNAYTVVQDINIPNAILDKRNWEFSDEFLDVIDNLKMRNAAFVEMTKSVKAAMDKVKQTSNIKKSPVDDKVVRSGEFEFSDTGDTADVDGLSEEDVEELTGKKVKKPEIPTSSTAPSIGLLSIGDIALDTEISEAVYNLVDIVSEEMTDEDVTEFLDIIKDIGANSGANMSLILNHFVKQKNITAKEANKIGEVWNENNKEDQINKCK